MRRFRADSIKTRKCVDDQPCRPTTYFCSGKHHGRLDLVDEEAEEALRSRSNPLSDLVLAKYANYMATVQPMFQAELPCTAIRLAVLSNVMLGERGFDCFPVELFSSPELAAAGLAAAPDEEIQALFENPRS